jgi:hypothetical protein
MGGAVGGLLGEVSLYFKANTGSKPILLHVNPGSTICNTTRQILAYADDTAIVTRSTNALMKSLNKCRQHHLLLGLIINAEKTKYMRGCRRGGMVIMALH